MAAATHHHPARLGFAASAGVRALTAAAFAGAISAALLVVEGMPEGTRSVPVTLSIEATATVDRWVVRVDGGAAHGDATGPASWSGELPIDAADATIEAHAAQGGEGAPLALKLILRRHDHAIEQLAWGNGSVACTLHLRHGDHHD